MCADALDAGSIAQIHKYAKGRKADVDDDRRGDIIVQSRTLANPRENNLMQWFFCFFLISGFCSILYELIWLRIAMAEFGVTTAMVSLVLSAFMVGLGFGSWGSGIVARKYLSRSQFPVLWLYALMELLIGISALIVPYELLWGRELLRALREISLSSSAYYVPSGIWIGLTLVPWCTWMGATFPFAMTAIRQLYPRKDERSFSHLYLANVLGATAGTVFPLLVIELYGFRWTLHFSAALNLLLAIGAFSLALVRKPTGVVIRNDELPSLASPLEPRSGKFLLWLLFGTGLTSMGVEVVWVRLTTGVSTWNGPPKSTTSSPSTRPHRCKRPDPVCFTRKNFMP